LKVFFQNYIDYKIPKILNHFFWIFSSKLHWVQNCNWIFLHFFYSHRKRYPSDTTFQRNLKGFESDLIVNIDIIFGTTLCELLHIRDKKPSRINSYSKPHQISSWFSGWSMRINALCLFILLILFSFYSFNRRKYPWQLIK
jgi:hypothetical protein